MFSSQVFNQKDGGRLANDDDPRKSRGPVLSLQALRARAPSVSGRGSEKSMLLRRPFAPSPASPPRPDRRAEELFPCFTAGRTNARMQFPQPQLHTPNIPALDPHISAFPGSPMHIFVRQMSELMLICALSVQSGWFPSLFLTLGGQYLPQ